MNHIISIVAGFLSGLFGSMGLGGGGILVIYLTFFSEFEQISAQGINLIFFVSISLIAVIFFTFKKLVPWRLVFPAILCGIPGAMVGFCLSSIISSEILGKIFGVFLIFIGIYQIFQKSK